MRSTFRDYISRCMYLYTDILLVCLVHVLHTFIDLCTSGTCGGACPLSFETPVWLFLGGAMAGGTAAWIGWHMLEPSI